MSETDFDALIEPVARHLWGEPNKSLSSKLSLRWGSGGSRAVFLDGGGNWKDFEADEQGGVLALVMRETGADKSGAVEWLKQEGFLEDRQPENRQQPRQDGRSSPPVDDGPSNPEPPQGELIPDEAGEWVPVKGYRYVNSDGEPLYEVIRKHFRLADGTFAIDPKTGNPKKTFAQRHKGADGRYIDNIKGIPHTIYRHDKVELAIAESCALAIVEGEKDVESLEGLGWTATTNSGGAGNWRPDMAEIFRGADVVVMVDNDDVGRAAGEKRALSLRGIAARIRLLDFGAIIPGFPNKHDVSDWIAAGGTASQLSEIINTLPDWRPARPKSRFTAINVAETIRQRKHDWLVKDMIELHGSCSFAGFSQAGKSFIVAHLAFCVARGIPFFGREVKQGLVVYQIGEGELGFYKRVEGYKQDQGIGSGEGLPLEFIPHKINLFVDAKDTDDLIAACKDLEAYHGTKLRLVVIDTFNKATRGANEISGQDMGKVNNNVERIADECDCTVIVVDHLNKGGDLRGHGSKTGDMTNTIKVTLLDRQDTNGRKIRRLKVDKNKDGESDLTADFVLRQVTLPPDEQGNAVTTCVVDIPEGAPAEEVAKWGLSTQPALFLQMIKDTADIEGEKPPAELVQIPPGRNVAKWSAVLDRVRKTWTFRETDPTRREAEMGRIIKDCGNRLKLAGYIDRDNTRGLIWWTGKSERPRQTARAPEAPPTISPGMKEAIEMGDVPF